MIFRSSTHTTHPTFAHLFAAECLSSASVTKIWHGFFCTCLRRSAHCGIHSSIGVVQEVESESARSE